VVGKQSSPFIEMVGKQSSPLIEMAGKQFFNLCNCSGVVLKKAILTAYGNGYVLTPPFI
jgi:hypothetical protein